MMRYRLFLISAMLILALTSWAMGEGADLEIPMDDTTVEAAGQEDELILEATDEITVEEAVSLPELDDLDSIDLPDIEDVEIGAEPNDDLTEPVGAEELRDNDGGVSIDEAHFPDYMFRELKVKKYDKDGDGKLSSAEIEAVTEIDCSNHDIRSLEGIGYFYALKHLICITEYDQWYNTHWPNKIASLDLRGCVSLESLNCYCTELTSLNVTGCIALKTINCSGNLAFNNHLTELDLSGCKALESLSCEYGGVVRLNLSGCTALRQLRCPNNPMIELDISGCTSLTEVDCIECQLTRLNASGCTALNYFSCYGNQLTDLDLSTTPSLLDLRCYDNQLTKLDLSGCAKLENLSCSDNLLTSLDASGCDALEYLKCSNNPLSGLEVPVSRKLKVLDCCNNQLAGLNTANLTELTTLLCSGNQLEALDISANTSLQRLSCYANRLKELDVSACEKLNTLHCQNNNLSRLYLYNCPGLIHHIQYYSYRESSGYREYYVTQTKLGDYIGLSCDLGTKIVTTKPPRLSATDMTLMEGETFAVIDERSETKAAECNFTSSDANVATVDAEGIVRGVSQGSATITACAKEDDGLSGVCTITVLQGPDSITLEPDKLTIGEGESHSLQYTFLPWNAHTEISWQSSDERIATVDANDNVVGLKAGSAVITVSALNGKTASCKLKVTKKPDKVVLSSGGKTLKQGATIELPVGQSLKFKAALPRGCASATPFKWENSNRLNVAMSTDGWSLDTVHPEYMNTDCELTAIRPGTATITVWAYNKVAKGTLSVHVSPMPSKVKLDGDSLVWECYVGQKRTLMAKVQPFNAYSALTWKSSNTKVATVNKNGLVRAVGKGSATISVTTVNGKTSSCAVRVKALPGKLTLNKSRAAMGVGDTLVLSATLPKGVRSSLKWSSSDKNVATVNTKGMITAVGKGKATITVKAGSDQANCVINVKAPAKSIKLPIFNKTLTVGQSFTLYVNLRPRGSASVLYWESSNTRIATVDPESGKVTALREGTATITVRANGCTPQTCKVTVCDPNPVRYRALLISIKDEEHNAPFHKSVDRMQQMLSKVKGPDGGSYVVTPQKDTLRTAEGVHAAIRKAFAEADDNDVSLFFITTHGKEGSREQYIEGALSMQGNNDPLPLPKLAGWLNAVPGKVIVIISSCYSGTAIHSNAGGANDRDFARAACEAFDSAAVQAFASIDPGIPVDENGIGIPAGEVRANRGEYRIEYKFYVLTEADYNERGNSASRDGNWFIRWLTAGIGSSGKMPADSFVKKDGVVTLEELYRYITKAQDDYQSKHPFEDDKTGENIYQHAQVYPSNSSYALFKRK